MSRVKWHHFICPGCDEIVTRYTTASCVPKFCHDCRDEKTFCESCGKVIHVDDHFDGQCKECWDTDRREQEFRKRMKMLYP
jgi:phage terminase large subunit GpA-like protein